MTQRTIDLFVRIAIEVVDWINILLKEKKRKGKNDRNRTTETQ
ncbi:hypothetical protein [Desulfosarcina variabilis]